MHSSLWEQITIICFDKASASILIAGNPKTLKLDTISFFVFQPFAASSSDQSLSPVDIIKSVTKTSRIAYLKKKILYYLTLIEKLKRSGCSARRIEHLGEWKFAELSISSNSAGANNAASATPAKLSSLKSAALTTKDIDRDRGKPLSKYERNIMIFDWLFNVSDIA